MKISLIKVYFLINVRNMIKEVLFESKILKGICFLICFVFLVVRINMFVEK